MPETLNTELLAKQLLTAPIAQIADVVRRDWKNISAAGYAAVPYLRAMLTLGDMSGSYGMDSAKDVVLYFLCNAQAWRGPVARVVKAELNKRVKAA